MEYTLTSLPDCPTMWDQLTHRLALAKAAREVGYEVRVATPSGPVVDRICDCDFVFHKIPLSRKERAPHREIPTISEQREPFHDE